jgi:uroporphyrinogen decarboxylase
MAEAIANEVKDFVLEFNKRYLNGAAGRCEYFACWDDVAMQNGLMFPPKDFIKYFLPVWKELISMVKSAGMFFSWHCCGNVNEVLPIMIDAGIDVFDVVQTSAKDMEIEKFYKNFGKSICIHGGIDVQKLLASGSHYEIREEVKKIRNLWGKNGGIIIGPSHEIVPETDIENVLTLYDELRK